MLTLTEQIKNVAFKQGFQKVGISSSLQPVKSDFLEEWLANRYHGNMDWMQTRKSKRME